MQTTVYHADHGVGMGLIEWALGQVKEQGFFARTFEIPAWARDLENRLWGPVAGDQPVMDDDESVFRWKRSADRPESKLTTRGARPTRLLTVIGVMGADDATVYTAHGGPMAAREVGDPSLDPAGKADSARFWAEHALAASEAEQAAYWADRAEDMRAVHAPAKARETDPDWP